MIARLLDAMRAEEASWAGRCRATNARARSLADVDEAARRACASLAYRDASATAECEQRTAHELRTMVDRADTRKCTPVSCPDTPVVLLAGQPQQAELDAYAWGYYTLAVPPNARRVLLSLTPREGDPDLYVRADGVRPTREPGSGYQAASVSESFSGTAKQLPLLATAYSA